MKETISKKMLKEAGVLLIVVMVVSSTVVVASDTMDKLENKSNYVNPSGNQNVDSGDSLFLQLPHDPDESWNMATSDAGAGYIMYENFWDVTEPIGDIHWWGLALKFTGSGWQDGNPNNLVFDIKFYADDPNDPNLPPDELIATFTNIVPPVITGTGQYYAGFEMYYFDGVELDTLVDLDEGWVSINSKSGGEGGDWLMWASAKTGDGFSYQENGDNPRYFDQAMDLTGMGSMPPETPQRPDGPTEGVIGVEYTFCTSTTDPEGEQVYYLWDWGDDTPTDWLGPFDSGATALANHTWTEVETYEIKVKAKDIHNVESGWSGPLMIDILDVPLLEIGNITGSLLKVSTVIKNRGGVDATMVNWNITLDGGIILLGKETTGSILNLPAGEEKTISSGLIFGFGKTLITVTAECSESSDTEERDAFVLLFFIL